MLTHRSTAVSANSTSVSLPSAENALPSPSPAMRARTAPKRVRVPNCTHITMERVFSHHDICFVCGRVPPLGFLYECRQDCDQPSARYNSPAEESSMDSKSRLRRELEEIGLSESIIVAAEQGRYTEEQLEKLKDLKLELKQVILDTVQGTQINNAVAKLAAFAPCNTDGACNSTSTCEISPPPCYFRACHTCRPYYKDRIYISFAAVFHDEFTPITPLDEWDLPVKSTRIMRDIGYLATPLPTPTTTNQPTPGLTLPSSSDPTSDEDSTHTGSSALTFKTTQTDVDDLNEVRRHRRRFYKIGARSSGDIARDLARQPIFSRQGLKSAMKGIFRSSRDSSSEGSNITLPMSRTGTARQLTDGAAMGEFDIGALRRVRRQKERNDLRSGMYMGGFEGIAGSPALHPQPPYCLIEGNGEDASSSSSEFSVYSCVSEGSEVEVDGGVALTEEAVETHTPDILSTLELDDRRGGKRNVYEIEVEQVESIMAQV